MLYIRKRRTPDNIAKKAAEIISTPDSGFEDITLPEDTEKLRKLFDQMPKEEIRQHLFFHCYIVKKYKKHKPVYHHFDDILVIF